MYLRQIELENFKSFGGKVTVPLMEGYMAITGPNGSGKSNIGDAIMFVLGPKSPKAVRAGRITDLIFSGSANKAKAKSMTVSLVFENSDRILPWDDDTVRLTRHVKLSDNGQDYTSYFYINDQKSTLGEFDSLLTKARISADGYNIVQQGDVTKIIHMGNIERRRILDGISGIASFDADIAKAQGEKSDATDNLDRIEILRGEKEKNLKALEKDREQAKLYIQAKGELDVAKAQLVLRQREREIATLDSTNEYIGKLNTQLETSKAEKAKALEDRQTNESAIAEKEAEILEKAGPEYKKIKDDVEAAKISLATIKDRMENAEIDIKSQEEFKSGYLESVEENRRTYAVLTENLNDLQIKHDAANVEYEAAKKEEIRVSEETAAHGGELTELQKKLELLGKQIDETSIKDQDARAAAATAKAVKEHALLAKADAEEALQSAQFEVKESDWNLKEVKKAVGPDLAEDISKRILALKKEESEIETQEANLRAIVDKRSSEYTRLSTEKKVTESLNGGSESVARILELKNTGQMAGIRGTIAELAKVEPGYETALGIAAAGKMQAIVVDTDATAARCIEYLKANRLSRVTFLPINKMMPGKPRAKAIMVLKKTEGYATDFLDFAPEYTNVFWYVFQDTLVVKDMDSAREIMGGVRLVTRDGELLEASGAMTGGTINKAKMTKFGSSSQGALDEAAASLRNAQTALESARAKLRDIRDKIRAADDEMRAVSAQGIDARGKVAAAEAAYEQAKKVLKAAEETLNKRNAEVLAAEKDVIQKGSFSEGISKTLEILRNDRTQARERMAVIAPAGLQERIQKIRDNVYNCSQTVADLSAQIGAAKAEQAGLDKQKEAYDLQIAEIDKKIESQRKAIEEYSAKVTQLAVELEALRKIESDMEAGIEGLKTQKDALIEKRYQLDTQIQKIQTTIETKEGLILTQNAAVLQIQQNIAALDAEVAMITVEVPEPIPSEESLKRTIRACEEKINNIGNVNLRAIDEYDERQKEYEVLIEQVKVLNKQIEELDKLTMDLTSKKKGLFMEAYNAVNDNFKAIYSQLSGGGEGFMNLDNEEDPFSGGLQINAKPRNGRLLKLEALSGGEKSLTALAFIFAIQEYQPSPFYVLDEVDMFLDAVNTEMVAKRVKESSAKAQFIQVSLRKVALTLADHLIGVTRPPTGISKIIIQPDLAEVSKYEEEALKKQAKSEENIEG
ncbi:MAG: chromosome segregation protein SMC [archaeon]|nr:chromosome segregation protein SMC [archaeon]